MSRRDEIALEIGMKYGPGTSIDFEDFLVVYQAWEESQRVVGEKDAEIERLASGNRELMNLAGSRADQIDEYKKSALHFASQASDLKSRLAAAEKVIAFYSNEMNWSPAYKGSKSFLNAISKDDMEPFGGGEFCGGKMARQYSKGEVKNG